MDACERFVDAVDTAAERVGDGGRLESVEVAQLDDAAVVIGQFLETVTQSPGLGVAIVLIAGELLRPLRLNQLEHVVLQLQRLALLLADDIDGLVARRGQGPADHVGFVVKLCLAGDRLGQDFLEAVLRLVGVVQDRVHIRQHADALANDDLDNAGFW